MSSFSWARNQSFALGKQGVSAVVPDMPVRKNKAAIVPVARKCQGVERRAAFCGGMLAIAPRSRGRRVASPVSTVRGVPPTGSRQDTPLGDVSHEQLWMRPQELPRKNFTKNFSVAPRLPPCSHPRRPRGSRPTANRVLPRTSPKLHSQPRLTTCTPCGRNV